MMIDAGLTINSPYPIILRTERHCDVIISFDFSAREKAEMMPFSVCLIKIVQRAEKVTQSIASLLLLSIHNFKYVYNKLQF